jgi:hypothetical protein
MIGIENSGYDKQVARIPITGPKAGGWGAKAGRRWQPKKKGRIGETNPTELTCFLSTTCLTNGRNRPNADMSNDVSNLGRN